MPFRQRDYLDPVSNLHTSSPIDLGRGFSSKYMQIIDVDGKVNEEANQNFSEIAKIEGNDSEKKKLRKDLAKQNLTKHMINDDNFATFCISHLHQNGIYCALERAMNKRLNEKFKDSFLKGNYKSQRKFKVVDDKLIITENVKVINITDPYKCLEKNKGKIFNTPPDKSLLEAKANYVISKNNNGQWTAYVADVTFDYKNKDIKKYFDSRSIATKIKDWFKSIFNLNKEQKKPFSKHKEKYLFLAEKNNENKDVARYCDKTIIC